MAEKKERLVNEKRMLTRMMRASWCFSAFVLLFLCAETYERIFHGGSLSMIGTWECFAFIILGGCIVHPHMQLTRRIVERLETLSETTQVTRHILDRLEKLEAAVGGRGSREEG